MKTTKGFKMFSTILIVAAIIGAIWFIANKTEIGKKIAPNSDSQTEEVKKGPKGEVPYKVSVNTWGGFAGGIYMNGGFKANTESRFYKEGGILVEFILQDDFQASREAWKNGDVDLLWATADELPTETEGLSKFSPKVIMQVDWSRGGDAVVVNRTISTGRDLKGKKIAYAQTTPSHSLLIWLLDANDLQMSDIQPIEVPGAIQAAELFKTGNCDACITWSPNDEECIASVKGSKILLNTKSASNIIADVMFAKQKFIEAQDNDGNYIHKDGLKKLVELWLKGNAELNSSEDAKNKAAQILTGPWNSPLDFCLLAINNARLATLGDNQNFFNINGNFSGVTGDALYSKMAVEYKKLGFATNPPGWKTVSYSEFIANIKLPGNQNLAEGTPEFTPVTEEMKVVESFSSKRVTINFPTASYTLDEKSKDIIENWYRDVAKKSPNARIRIEGNTDNVGNSGKNQTLSEQRAQSVANYLMREYDLPANKFVIIGNGSNKPIADNSSSDGKSQNRRTDFELIQK